MTEDKRPNWHTYFMKVAEMASTRATCPRKSVGAVIVRDRAILSTGYNGSVRGLPHCIEDGCMMEDNHCVRTRDAAENLSTPRCCVLGLLKQDTRSRLASNSAD